MSRLLLVDCPTGLAGSMLLGGLLDLGVPRAVIEAPLAALGVEGRYRLTHCEARSGGLRGQRLLVESLESQPPSRAWGELRRTLLAAPLETALQKKVLAVFTLLAEAEAAVHGQPPDTVHFHELGALDTLVDVVGVCAALLQLAPERCICTPPPAGHGSLTAAHGTLPLPAPAVLEIARRRSIPLAGSDGFPPCELTTPTGLALMAVWADAFGPAPALLPRQVGLGLGSHALGRPNLLRLVLAEAPPPAAQTHPQLQAGGPAQPQAETLLEQQAQIDDATSEDLAFLAEALRAAGALEVFSQPLLMKKGRPGTLLVALAPPQLAEALRQVWWRHSTTLGLREQLQTRWWLPRQGRTLVTGLGPVRLKVAALPDGSERLKAEHEDLARLAHSHNLSLEQVRAEVRRALLAAPAGDPPHDSACDPPAPPNR
ncbi:MAG: LarC family nickel insertion protein [Synechococcaceae cyanobacterium]|nr:LarC family nickel insertion protein [Synechococcaceae cyanobacterium]